MKRVFATLHLHPPPPLICESCFLNCPYAILHCLLFSLILLVCHSFAGKLLCRVEGNTVDVVFEEVDGHTRKKLCAI